MKIIGICILLALNLPLMSQSLILRKVSETVKTLGVWRKYQYLVPGETASQELKLYSNGSYMLYNTNSGQTFHSSGGWKISADTLVIHSSFSKDEFPISISYSKTAEVDHGFPILRVRNLKGVFLNDATVAVDNEKNLCLPYYRLCTTPVDKIDSVKVIFENGGSSKWLTVQKTVGYSINITVEVEFETKTNLIMNDRFKIYNDRIEYLTE